MKTPDAPPLFGGTRMERFRFIAFLLFIFVCVLGGGASREDVISLLYVRPAAILFIAAILLVPGRIDFRTFRILFILLAAVAVTIAIQLVPLPPEVWASLPGRDRYAEATAAAGLAPAWRPITLTPDLTWNSLLALLPPLAALVGFAAIRQDQRYFLLFVLIAIAGVSAVLGIAQITGPVGGPSYLYSVTHNGSAVGVFANRNHQAALLAATFPMLRMWSLLPTRDPQRQRFRFWMALGIGVALIPMILITGSRAGTALALVGILAAYGLARNASVPRKERGKGGLVLKLGLWLAPPVLAVSVFMLGRALAVERLLNPDMLQEELRVQHTPLMLKMVWDFFPFGSGFGSFDPVFRGYEPDAALTTLYFNRAHNDLIELALSGGLPAVLVLAAFIFWWVRASISALFPYRGRSEGTLFGRLGAIVIAILLLASLVDYPLRTPLMAVVFVIACGWLAQSRSLSLGRRDAEAAPPGR